MVVVETPRLILRQLTVDDAPFILALMSDADFVANIGDRGLRSEADARGFIDAHMIPAYQRPGHGLNLVQLRTGGDAIGICGLLYREALEETDIGYATLPRYRGQGYTLEAAKACMTFGREVLGLSRIVGFTRASNLASVQLLEKLGLRYDADVEFSEGVTTGRYV